MWKWSSIARVAAVALLPTLWVLASLRVASAADRCIGGAVSGTVCASDIDCSGACTTGTRACLGDADCTGTCSGGASPGTSCLNNASCPGLCAAGKNPGAACTMGSDCLGGCSLIPTLSCTSSIDCAAQAAGKCTSPAPGTCTGPAPGSCTGIGTCTAPHPGRCAAPAVFDTEPNDSTATGTPLPETNMFAIGNIFPAGDVDYYSFAGLAGDRLDAATIVDASPGPSIPSADSVLDLIAPDGTTLLESDDNDGPRWASAIAGALLPSSGTYHLRIKSQDAAALARPYHLRFRLQRGTPRFETEPNDTEGTANDAGPARWVAGGISPAGDRDTYDLGHLEPGETVYLSLDLDPERDGATFNGIAGVSILNWGGNYLMMNEAPSGVPPVGNATAFTVQAEGRYYALVQDMTEGGGLSYTYRLSISLQSPPQVTSVCTTYSSTDVPKSITGSFIQSTLTVPGHPRIADLDVSLGLTHGRAEDLDLQLTAPAGSTSSLLTDIPSVLTTLLMTLDDEAAQPPPFLLPGFVWQPERSYRLSWFDGEDAGGTWTLRIHDDAVGNAGALTSWSLKICEPDPACPSGTAPVDLFTTDFETGPAGFTHAGTSDEWEWGLPAFPPITGCNSGSHCWKTDLDNTYDASSVQDLLSPVIDLSGITAPLRASWAQKYQMEDAASDHAFAEIQEIPAANPKKLFEFLDATMTDSVGSGPTLVDESAGWGVATADISSYASKHVQMRFHLDSNATVDLAGYAIDDVRVFMCCPSIAVGPTTLPGGREGVFYSQTLMATGGAGPHGFAVASGSLPPGLSLSTGGVLSGTPSAAGVYNLGVKATDTTGCYAATNLTITVALGPHEASPSQNMTVQRLPTGLVLVTYTPACGATDHVIYQGTGPIAGALSWNRAICNRGTGGSTSYNPLNNAPGAFVYFVIVGQNATEEGSYGRSSAGIERPEATIVSTCDKPKILTGPCP